MHVSSALRWRTVLAAIAALALLPAAAHAELTVALVGADALEDRTMTFIATGATNETNEIYAKFRLAAGVPCAPSYSADSGSSLFFADLSGAQAVITRDDPGSYVVCAYLASTSRQAPAEVFALPVAVRANAATLTISAPARSHPGADVPVTLVGTTELARNLYAMSKPVSAGPCGASRAADLSSKSFAFFEPASGTFSVPRVAGPFRDEGRYTLCAWLQESGTDAVAEASASAVIDVVAPIPIMSSLDMLPSTFATQSRGGFTTDGLPAAGISFRLTNTPARVRFTVAARRTGRRVGSRCDKPTRSNRRRARCWRYPLVPGSYTYDAGQGTNYLRFSGRIGGRRLGPGTYRLLVSARTITGRGKTLRHTFHIVRSR